MEFNAKIKNGAIHNLAKEDGTELGLIKPIPLDEYGAIENCLRKIGEYINLAEIVKGVNRWTFEEVKDFIKDRNEKQRAFYQVLVVNGPDRVLDKDVFEGMSEILGEEINGRVWSGSYGGMRRTKKKMGRETLTKKVWIHTKDDKWLRYYKIKSRYFDQVREAIESN